MIRKTTSPILAVIATIASISTAEALNSQPALLQTIGIDVDRYAFNETLSLRTLGAIDAGYAGHALHQVIVDLNLGSAGGQVELLVDGQVVDSASTAGQQAVALQPSFAGLVFDQQFHTLELRTVGWVYIDDIDVAIFQPASMPTTPPPPPATVCAPVERQVYTQLAFTQLSLNGLFDLSQYAGCRIDSVTVVARSATGLGQAAPLVNGWQAGDWTEFPSAPGQQTLDFWSDPAAGTGAPQLALSMLGLFTVDTVRLNLVAN
jgi:hypothetical protein